MREELMLSPEIQNLGQVEYDDIQMAIQKLSSASQEQFEEIKQEKWYNRLWDMVTFSQKGKKRLAEQIGTVAQAQQILVEMLLRLSDQDRNISELVMKNSDYIERIQRDNIYLLTEINLLKDKIADINVKVKYDANIKDLNDEEKRALSGCLYNLAELNDSPSDRQKEYLNTILNYVDENTRMENPFAAIENLDSKIKGKILVCCMEYMFLEKDSTDTFDKYQEFIDEFDCGKKTISDLKEQVESIYKARGEQGFIDRYRNIDKGVSASFYVELGEDSSEDDGSEDDYDEITNKGIEALNNNDYEEAARLFKIAADHGHADAQNRYGVRLYYGQGVPENKEEALRYYTMAANQGHCKGLYNLAAYYKNGDFVEKDDEKAKELLKVSAAKGDDDAVKLLWDWYGIWGGGVSEETIGDANNRDIFLPQSIVEIPKEKSIRIVNKIINATSFVKLAGCLQIDNCVVYYNGESVSGEIELGDSAFLSVKNTSIVCKGYNKKPLIKTDSKESQIVVEKCTFIDCNYLFMLEYFKKFEMSYCRIVNMGSDFLFARHYEKTKLSIDNCYFELSGLSDFNKPESYLTAISLSGWGASDLKPYLIQNCLFKQSSEIQDSEGNDLAYTFIDATYSQINNCTIKGMRGPVASFKNTQFFDDVFVDSRYPVSLCSNSGVTSKIEQCLFDHCDDVISLCQNANVDNCQFISCNDHIIDGHYYGGCRIEYCEFVNIRHEASNKSNRTYGFYNNACVTFRRAKGKDTSANNMLHCIFNGADVADWLLVDIAGFEKPSGRVLQIENCDFRNCKTSRKDLLGEFIIYSGLFNTSNSINGVYKNNCTGLDNKNGSGAVDIGQIKIKEIGSDGKKIGIGISEEEIAAKAGASNV